MTSLARFPMYHRRENRLLWLQERLSLATTFSQNARKAKSRARTKRLRHPLKTMNPERLALSESPRTVMFCRNRMREHWKTPRRAPPQPPSRIALPHPLMTLHHRRALRQRKERSRGRWMLNRQRQMRSAKNCSPMRIRDREVKIGGERLIHRVDYVRPTCYAMPTLLFT